MLQQMIPPETELAKAYEASRNIEDQNLINNLCIYLTTFLSEHTEIVESVSGMPSCPSYV